MNILILQKYCYLPSLWVTTNRGYRSLGNNTEVNDGYIIRFLVFLSVYVPMCMYVCSAPRDQKRPVDLLELELEMALSCPVNAGNQIRVLYKNCKC